MERTLVEQIIHEQITAIREKKQKLLSEAADCDIQEEALSKLLSEFGKRELQIAKDNISREVKKGITPGFLLERDDKARINLFLEFMEKCGDEAVHAVARAKMPKLEYYIYRKKFWANWKEFREDYHRWVNREGKYEGILDK